MLHMGLDVLINLDSKSSLPAHAELDSGCTLFALMSPNFALRHNIPRLPLRHPVHATTVTDEPLGSGIITERTPAYPVKIHGHLWEPSMWFMIADIGKRDILIGLPWLTKHDPDVRWQERNILPRAVETTRVPPAELPVIITPIIPPNPMPPLPTNIPDCYSEFADLFDIEAMENLPPLRGRYDFPIDLIPGAEFPKSRKIYPLTAVEDAELRRLMEEGLRKGTWRRSQSTTAHPIFFKHEPDKLRLCHDLRGKNECLLPDGYPLPHLHDQVEEMKGYTYYSKWDLRKAYHQTRIRPGDEPKTAFKTKYGTFETLVMFEGWMNAPPHFQRMVDEITQELKHLKSYIDDNGIYTNGTLQEHINANKSLLQVMRKHHYYLNPKKCVVHASEIPYGGYRVGTEGARIADDSLTEINELPRPVSVGTTQAVLGLLLYFQEWIPNFPEVVRPLQEVATPNATFVWGSAQEAAFQYVKECCKRAPCLAPADRNRPFVMYTDASGYAIGAVLLQADPINGKLRPIQFRGRKLKPPERNYSINDKELLAIVDSFKHWRSWLSGTVHLVEVRTDHRNLTYFTTNHRLTPRHLRWMNELGEYRFRIQHVPATQNKGADALSRNPAFIPSAEETTNDREQVLLPKEYFLPRPVYPVGSLESHPLLDVNNPLHRLEICRLFHDHETAGHPSWERTYDKIRAAGYDWKGMRRFIHNYVQSCDSCQRNKPSRRKPYGPLQPLPVPQDRWTHVNMDFIVKLPNSEHRGILYDSILVVVDRKGKLCHLIPCNESITAEETAQLYIDYVYRHHGLPLDITSDRGPQFMAKFWETFWKLLNVHPSLTTAFHPEGDGGVERVNQEAEIYLRHYVNYEQNDWAPKLALAEFRLNNTYHETIGTTPFFANTMRHPIATPADQRPVTAPHAAAESAAQDFKDLSDRMQAHMENAQAYWKKHADARRLEVPFKVHDLVWLQTRNLQTTRPSKKLDYKFIGPYPITEQLGPVTFKVGLPAHLKIHDVFHASLLKPHVPNTIEGRVPEQAPPVFLDNSDVPEWEVEAILDARRRGRGFQYLVHWKGYGIADRTWEPWGNVQNSLDLILSYHRAHPHKPCPIHIRKRIREGNGGEGEKGEA